MNMGCRSIGRAPTYQARSTGSNTPHLKIKEIEYLINFLQKTTKYWNLVQGIPSQKIYNLLFADWNKGFFDSSKLWGCSSNGRALSLHARGTGIDAPNLQN